MKAIKFNGRIRYNKETKTYFVTCEICWESPKGKWGQGFVSECRSEASAKGSLSRHIRLSHGVEPLISIGLPIQN
jgi:hypothetical protein